MRLLIINCSPRRVQESNTEKILDCFRAGFERCGGTTQSFCLSKRGTWEDIRRAFEQSSDILFALPLYVECIPGIMMEFLETLKPKDPQQSGVTRVSFLLQGGFPEASQLRCCESYLERLPEKLGCEYNGTLIKGDMFGVRFLDDATAQKQVEPFADMGEAFAKDGGFKKDKCDEFAGPEYMTKGALTMFKLFSPIQRLFLRGVARKEFGCSQPLDAKPLETER